MCLTNRRNGQHYKVMHFTHARNWQQWLLGGHIVPQEAWQNCVQQKPLLHVFSVCDPHLRGCVFKNGTEDFSSHICQNSGYLLFERCGSICLPCLWPNSLGPLYTPCQLLRKLSRALAGTEIWSLLCSLFEPVPCVERWNMNVNTLWCFEISLPIPAFQRYLKRVQMFMTYHSKQFEPEFWVGNRNWPLWHICKMVILSMHGGSLKGCPQRNAVKYEQEAKLSELCNRKGHSQGHVCQPRSTWRYLALNSWHAHKQITQSGFEWCLRPL
jgi:hypothetical protein